MTLESIFGPMEYRKKMFSIGKDAGLEPGKRMFREDIAKVLGITDKAVHIRMSKAGFPEPAGRAKKSHERVDRKFWRSEDINYYVSTLP
jgi:hypothetical protein